MPKQQVSKAAAKTVDAQKVARSAIIDCIKADVGVQDKWLNCAHLVVDAFGANVFLPPKDNSYDKAGADAVRGIIADALGGMKPAPERTDKSDEAKALREERRGLQMRINTYFTRMQKYAVQGGQRRGATSRSPADVIPKLAKQIKNLYFSQNGGVSRIPSAKFGHDIQVLELALTTMATGVAFSAAWEQAEKKFNADKERTEAAQDKMVAAKVPAKGRSRAAEGSHVVQ